MYVLSVGGNFKGGTMGSSCRWGGQVGHSSVRVVFYHEGSEWLDVGIQSQQVWRGGGVGVAFVTAVPSPKRHRNTVNRSFYVRMDGW